jgi:hypothetical protein
MCCPGSRSELRDIFLIIIIIIGVIFSIFERKYIGRHKPTGITKAAWSDKHIVHNVSGVDIINHRLLDYGNSIPLYTYSTS